MKFSFSPNIVHTFTQGDCYRLARSMTRHEYPLVLVGVADTDKTEMFWVHALNQLPDGRFVDITGTYADEHELMHAWDEEISNVRSFAGLEETAVIVGDKARAILDDSCVTAFYPNVSASRYANSIHAKLSMV